MSLNKTLFKASKYSAWMLLPLMVIYFLTGFVMLGTIEIMGIRLARDLHVIIRYPALILVLIHAGVQIYFLISRWKRKIRKTTQKV